MKTDEALKRIPKEGFLKIGKLKPPELQPQQKTALNRKGNELFNSGNLDQARKIFITTGYTDGLIRLGDIYKKEGRILDALKMYWAAPAPKKVEQLIERAVVILRSWLKDEGNNGEIHGRPD